MCLNQSARLKAGSTKAPENGIATDSAGARNSPHELLRLHKLLLQALSLEMRYQGIDERAEFAFHHFS